MKLFVLVGLFYCSLASLEARIENKFSSKHHRELSPPHPSEVDTNSVGNSEDNKNSRRGDIRNYHSDHALGYRKVGGHDNRENGHHGNGRNHGHHHDKTEHHQQDLHDRDQQEFHHESMTEEKVANSEKRTKAFKVWKKINKAKPVDGDPCEKLHCKRKHVCLVNAETSQAECVHKKLLRQRRKLARATRKTNKLNKEPGKREKNKKSFRGFYSDDENSQVTHKKAHQLAEKIKKKAEKFKNKYEEKKRHHLHHIKNINEQMRGEPPIHAVETTRVKKSGHKATSLLGRAECSQKDLQEMGSRLLDWFKLLQDTDLDQTPHVIQKRNSHKKELHEQDECICQAPVRYEFLKLDEDHDNSLSVHEVSEVQSNGYEHCIGSFVKMCDHDNDGSLSDHEWCCCFADVLPPCLAEMKKVPARSVSSGEAAVLPGAFVPQCDSDGFYEKVQCHSSIGYCWCVDRHGQELEETRTRGTPTCGETDDNEI